MGIQEINFPSTLTSIGRYAFGNCKNIKKMTFTSSDKNELVIEDYAFYKGSSSSTAECSVTLPENLVSIGTNAFQYSRLTSINIPAKVTSIGQYAFANVAGLESVTIGKDSQLTEIGANAFASTTVASSRSNLESINLEVCSKLTSIGASAFVNCIYLNNVKLPASLETIGASAFSGCTGLSNFEFMYNEENGTKINNLKSVGNYAFASTSFTELTIHESTNTTGITLGDALFNKCTELKTLNLPLSVTDIGGSLKLCSSIERIRKAG
jgi:hypothetical protein